MPIARVGSHSMRAWRLCSSSGLTSNVDGPGALKLHECWIPTISAPSDVLVQVRASSINPLDICMMRGYGRNALDLFNLITNFEPTATSDRYPLTLGRDFSGEIVSVGNNVTHFKPGDLVYGVVEPQKQGAHAEFVTTHKHCIYHKPKNLTHIEAASIPFAALTAWSAIYTIGKVTPENAFSKSTLILGGSGGVGSIAVQLLKNWGSSTTATASNETLEWLKDELQVDRAIDYSDRATMSGVERTFDFVLDAGKYPSMTYEQIVRASSLYAKQGGGVYVTLSPPILENTDKFGLLMGTAKTAFDAAKDIFNSISDQPSVRWGLFMPNQMALRSISKLIESGKLKPHIKSVHAFEDIQTAYESAESGSRGLNKLNCTLGSARSACVVVNITCQSMPSSDMAAFRAALAKARHVVALTGAGVSAESGIPTFRGPQGLWKKYESSKLATPGAFSSDPSLVWQFYHYRRELVLSRVPNMAHKILADTEKKFKAQGLEFCIVTQNVDELHQRAGSENVLELHGTLFKTKCTKCGDVAPNHESPITEGLAKSLDADDDIPLTNLPISDLPSCKKCTGLLRPAVVWFGEALDPAVLKEAQSQLDKCDLCLVIGTSSVVYPAAMFAPAVASRGVPVAEFNLEVTPNTGIFGFYFKGECSKTLAEAFSEFTT
ncbi:NAD-dependent protein deacylase sirtuin-5, mitochondrial [Fragariocoptes setiger]|uniref:NAD-dependent protein deacylase n=1 Tax=Fragariocoptes setiger TaxID=1670756 RepID=A0ABQ7S8H3_9ACAR|nr:NAD-dependent protein deacylase sirtuin-5, mitochondrial [Fragariocoptes setiger]